MKELLVNGIVLVCCAGGLAYMMYDIKKQLEEMERRYYNEKALEESTLGLIEDEDEDKLNTKELRKQKNTTVISTEEALQDIVPWLDEYTDLDCLNMYEEMGYTVKVDEDELPF